MAGELWLIRHAETEWSKAQEHTGRTDIPLTDVGREHAARCASSSPAWTSPPCSSARWCARAATAELAGFGDRAEVLDDLMEWDYGAYEGRHDRPEIRAERPEWFLWTDGVPGGERADDVGARADRVIARAVAVEGDRPVALFGHGHILRVLAARWIEQPAALGGRLALNTAGIGRCGYERDVRVLTGWNI